MQGTVQGISLPGDMPPNCGPWGTATGTDHIDRSLDPGGKPGAAVIIPQSFTCGDCVGVKGGLGQNIMIPMVMELSVLNRIGNVGKEPNLAHWHFAVHIPEPPRHKGGFVSMLDAQLFGSIHTALPGPL